MKEVTFMKTGNMRIKALSFIILICSVSVLNAQETPTSAPSTPQTNQTNTQSNQGTTTQAAIYQQRMEEERRRRQQDQAFDRLRSLEAIHTRNGESGEIQLANINALYRKPTRKELELLKPDPRDIQKYAAFVKAKNAGLFVLIPDAGCSENTKILVVTPECSRYSMPGAGSSYSFRTRNYRIPTLADLTYDGESLIGNGALVDVVLVDVGDVALDKITPQSNGLQFINEFYPITDPNKAFERSELLGKGIAHRGFVYGRGVFATEGTTFVMRSIAYRGKRMRAAGRFVYNELDYDKRMDIVVGFRIIRKGNDGSITILWKELSKQKSPKMEESK